MIARSFKISLILAPLFGFVCVLALVSPASAQLNEDYVRVRLQRDAAPRTIIVSSTKPSQLYAGDTSNPILELPAQTKLTLTTSNQQVYLRAGEGGIFARSLIIRQQEEAELTLEIAEGAVLTEPRIYSGFFLIQVDSGAPGTLQILNDAPLDQYVASVLSGEFNFEEMEASKALAICIRTLALQTMKNQNGPIYAVPDDESWQVYNGNQIITETALEATQETKGQVLLHDNELAEPVYFASSGGHTANNEDVWLSSTEVPYLRGKADPYDRNSPHHTWESTLDRALLHQALGSAYDMEVINIDIQRRSRLDNRVQTVRLTGPEGVEETISGVDFRRVVTEQFDRESLKSTRFRMVTQPEVYIFEGRGFGHGVGLNQWGALELSRRGQLYNEILDFYYTDIEIGLYRSDIDNAAPALAQTQSLIPSSNVPFINFNGSSSMGTVEMPEVNTASTSTASTSTSASGFSPSSILFGEADTNEDVASTSTAESSTDGPRTGEPEGESTPDRTRQYQPDARIVGWTKTIKPPSTQIAAPDSALAVDAQPQADASAASGEEPSKQTKKGKRRGW